MLCASLLPVYSHITTQKLLELKTFPEFLINMFLKNSVNKPSTKNKNKIDFSYVLVITSFMPLRERFIYMYCHTLNTSAVLVLYKFFRMSDPELKKKQLLLWFALVTRLLKELLSLYLDIGCLK